MLRTIEYTVSPNCVTPHSPQFAGVQGENGATQLLLKFSEDFMSAVEQLRESFDSVVFRFDCIDGAGRVIMGETQDFSEEEITFGLSSTHTEMGGNIKMLFVVSGVNNTENSATEIYSLPFMLYFKDFPVRANFSERHDLNKAVLQVKKMRAETYEIAAGAIENHQLIGEKIDDFEQKYNQAHQDLSELCEAAQTASDNAAEHNQSAAVYAQNAAEYAQSAAEYAAAAQTSNVQAEEYAAQAKEYMLSAEKSAQDASSNLAELLAVTGDINAVLATVVDG